MGLDYVEVDVQTTADGLLIDMHSEEVEATTDGAGLAREMRYAQIRSLDAGSWFSPKFKGEHVPLLGEVLALAKDRIGLYLDWKEADPKAVVPLLQEFDMTRDVLVHADVETCRQIRALDPTIPLMPGANSVEEVRQLAAALQPEAVEVRWRHFTEEAARVCRELGMRCATSLAGGRGDTPEEMRRAVAAGVELIETDEPEMLLEVLRSFP
jgi:glycerophosphoryl diester phosphodiesterase